MRKINRILENSEKEKHINSSNKYWKKEKNFFFNQSVKFILPLFVNKKENCWLRVEKILSTNFYGNSLNTCLPDVQQSRLYRFCSRVSHGFSNTFIVFEYFWQFLQAGTSISIYALFHCIDLNFTGLSYFFSHIYFHTFISS